MRLRFNNFGQKQKKTEEKLFGFSKSIFVVVVEFQFRWFVFLLDYFNISMTLLGINQNKWAISSRARPIQTHTTNRTRNYFECVFNLVAFYIFRAVTLSLSLFWSRLHLLPLSSDGLPSTWHYLMDALCNVHHIGQNRWALAMSQGSWSWHEWINNCSNFRNIEPGKKVRLIKLKLSIIYIMKINNVPEKWQRRATHVFMCLHSHNEIKAHSNEPPAQFR